MAIVRTLRRIAVSPVPRINAWLCRLGVNRARRLRLVGRCRRARRTRPLRAAFLTRAYAWIARTTVSIGLITWRFRPRRALARDGAVIIALFAAW